MSRAIPPRVRGMTIDGNLNWVKVAVRRSNEVARVHAVLSAGLGRPRLRPPVRDEIAVEYFDRDAAAGLEEVEAVIEERLGAPDWIEVEIGSGSVVHIYGARPE